MSGCSDEGVENEAGRLFKGATMWGGVCAVENPGDGVSCISGRSVGVNEVENVSNVVRGGGVAFDEASSIEEVVGTIGGGGGVSGGGGKSDKPGKGSMRAVVGHVVCGEGGFGN